MLHGISAHVAGQRRYPGTVGRMLPELQPDEALIEGIYTAESHRGLGIMPEAGTRIVEQRATPACDTDWASSLNGTLRR